MRRKEKNLLLLVKKVSDVSETTLTISPETQIDKKEFGDKGQAIVSSIEMKVLGTRVLASRHLEIFKISIEAVEILSRHHNQDDLSYRESFHPGN